MLYVLCRGSEYRPEGTRITVLTLDDEEYVTAFARGVIAQGPHAFNFDDGSLVWPTAIAFDRAGNVYVTDEWTNRVSIFGKDGDYISKWQERPGSGDGELNRPSGIAFDANDNAYVVDSGITASKIHQGWPVPGEMGIRWQRPRPVQYAVGHRRRSRRRCLCVRLA
jgi:DNA-binding beta-propeller fold protein YncE